MTQIAVPNVPASNARPGRRALVYAVPVAVAGLALGGYWLATRGGPTGGNAAAAAVYAVVPMDLDVRIIKSGELQAANNIEIQCLVEGQTAVQTLVKEGTTVKKGDVLATLDASAINQKIEDTTLELQRAAADVTTATEMVEIQKLANAANLEAADVALLLARLDLQQYTEGTYPQQVKDARTTVEMAGITLKNTQEDLEQTRDLASKGFVTTADVKKSELAVTVARQALDKGETALEVLTKYAHEADLAAKKNAVAQSDQRLNRTRRENASNLSQKQADAQAKQQALATLNRRMERLKAQLAACTVTAPADGIVVYATSGDRNAQNPLQEGGTVRERQPMFRLPDTSTMRAVVRVSESQVARLKTGLRATVQIGQLEPVGATLSKISVLADSSQRWFNPDLKEYPVDLALDHTPPDLKPGMTADVTVFVDRVEDATAVPVSAVYAAGREHYVFVRDADRARPVRVSLGQANETHVVIDGPVPAGSDVIVLQAGQGRTLLEAAGIRPAPEPTTGPSDGRRRRRET